MGFSMVSKSAVAVVASLLLSGAALAEGPLNGDAMRRVLSGKTVMLNTPVGTIPITYRENGTMSGRAKDMQLYVGSERDTGTWWVSANQVCQKWDTWLNGRAHCFTLRIEGQKVHWRSTDGRTGTATIASN